jgi:hypothetical protein
MNDIDLKAIPSSACRMASGEVEIGSNGEGAKSAPVKIKARSGGAIDHPYWGRIVHDFSGMRISKSKLPLDYNHESGEILGYANHFDFSSGDLIATGAITPWQGTDRASEVIFKMREGVPYEASIFFGGDGIKLEKVPDGKAVEVNGMEFAGPGVVVREWPLRGIAICPYGADENTQSMAFAEGKTVSAVEWQEPKQEEEIMADMPIVEETEKKDVEVVTVETEGAAEVVVTVETKPVEVEVKPEDEAAPAVEVPDELSVAKAEAAELRAKLEAAEKQNQEFAVKFAALDKGQPVVSAVADEGTKFTGSLMERARNKKR